MSESRFPDIHTFNVDQAGVLKLMQGLNPYKAEGPDHILTRFLKEFAGQLSPAMTLIFQASLQQGEVPDDWKQANVAPIFKKKRPQYCSKLQDRFTDISVQQDP